MGKKIHIWHFEGDWVSDTNDVAKEFAPGYTSYVDAAHRVPEIITNALSGGWNPAKFGTYGVMHNRKYGGDQQTPVSYSRKTGWKIPEAHYGMSVDFWFKPILNYGAKYYQPFATRGEVGGGRLMVDFVCDGSSNYKIGGDFGAQSFDDAANPTIAEGTWHHVALAYDGYSGRAARLFLDGVLVKKLTATEADHGYICGLKFDGTISAVPADQQVDIWDLMGEGIAGNPNSDAYGCIDELRVVLGGREYPTDASFTPPTEEYEPPPDPILQEFFPWPDAGDQSDPLDVDYTEEDWTLVEV